MPHRHLNTDTYRTRGYDYDNIWRKIRYLRRKNNLTQKQLGMAVGFPENTADVRIAQYETNARTPREEL